MRKLAVMSAAFSAGIFAANYIFQTAQLLRCSLILAVLGIVALIIMPRRRKFTAFVLLSAALGLLCFYGAYSSKAIPAKAACGDDVSIELRITAYPSAGKNCLKCEGILIGDNAPKLKCVIYDYNGLIASALPGSTYSMLADVSPADTMYGEDYEGYTSKNIFLIVKPRSEPELISEGSALSALPVRFSAALCAVADEIFPDDCAPFIKSLLIGSKSDFYSQTGLKLDFGRAGLMHVVAISGMHISMLAGLLFFIFGRKKHSSIICLVLVWFFVAAVGAPASACRAAVMQSSLLVAPLVRRENDGVTSLFLALAVLLAINPYSCASVGLQMSFAAMLGLVCFGDRLSDFLSESHDRSFFGKLKAYVLSTVAASLAATVFTLPLMVIHFGYVSLLAPLANILCLWGITVCFAGGFICCGLGIILPSAASVLAYIPAWISRYIFAVVGFTADIPYSVLYTSNPVYLGWIAFALLLILLSVFSKRGKLLRIALPLSLSVLSLAAAIFFVSKNSPANDGMISVIDVGQGQCIAVMSGDKTVLIDCGNISSPDDAGELAKAYLEKVGRKKVDAIIFTHLHSDHSDGLEALTDLEKVDIIYVPSFPSYDGEYLSDIKNIADSHYVELVTITSDRLLEFGDIKVQAWFPYSFDKDDERCMTLKVSVRNYDMLITGDSSAELEKKIVSRHKLSDIDALVVGHHGSKYSSCRELLDAVGGRTAVISVGYNSYGHPTNETLERLAEYGYNIMRTDKDGTIEIPIE